MNKILFLLKFWYSQINKEQLYNLYLFVFCLVAMLITVTLTMRLSVSIAVLIASTYILMLVSMVFWLRNPGNPEKSEE